MCLRLVEPYEKPKKVHGVKQVRSQLHLKTGMAFPRLVEPYVKPKKADNRANRAEAEDRGR